MSGQGGCFCTNNKKYFKKAKLLSHHGMDKINFKKFYWSKKIGYQYNWSNIQAALAYAQISRLKKLLDKKREIFVNYKKIFSNNKNFILNKKIKNIKQTYWLSYITILNYKNIQKEKLINTLNKKKIEIRPMFYPVSSMPAFKKFVKNKKINLENRNSYEISRNTICLPSGNNLILKDQIKVASELKKCFINKHFLLS